MIRAQNSPSPLSGVWWIETYAWPQPFGEWTFRKYFHGLSTFVCHFPVAFFGLCGFVYSTYCMWEVRLELGVLLYFWNYGTWECCPFDICYASFLLSIDSRRLWSTEINHFFLVDCGMYVCARMRMRVNALTTTYTLKCWYRSVSPGVRGWQSSIQMRPGRHTRLCWWIFVIPHQVDIFWFWARYFWRQMLAFPPGTC